MTVIDEMPAFEGHHAAKNPFETVVMTVSPLESVSVTSETSEPAFANATTSLLELFQKLDGRFTEFEGGVAVRSYRDPWPLA
jgi:hypothetical protein